MIDAIGVEQRGAAFDTVHLVALAQQEFGKIRPVLSGDSRDERDPSGRMLTSHWYRPSHAKVMMRETPVGNFACCHRVKSARRLLKSMKNHNTGMWLTRYGAGFDAIIA